MVLDLQDLDDPRQELRLSTQIVAFGGTRARSCCCFAARARAEPGSASGTGVRALTKA
ncbi:hypothetical protein ACFYOV_28850 [Streptomyces sp. NPDC005931]|uniref:hypothetical protein n=1 Tax=Streptomyces sp. NPDC005931 TaxID=3364737 RepID=UPI003679B762